jgi:hypothetical protein
VKKLSTSDACQRFRANMSELVGREASPAELAEAEAHRGKCSNCESEYRLAIRVEQGLRVLPEFTPGAALATRMERRSLTSAVQATALQVAFDPTQPVEIEVCCQEFRDMLGDFVSEELPVGSLLEGLDHASVCRGCGDELALMQTLQDSCRSLPQLDPPEQIWTQLMTRLDADEATQAAAAPAGESVRARKTARGAARGKLLPVLG